MIHFVTHEFAPFRGGGATYVREVATAAAHLGLRVRVIAPDYGRTIHPSDSTEPFPIVRVPGNGRLTPGGLWSLSRALARERETLRDEPIILLSVGAQMAMMLLVRFAAFRPTRRPVAFFHGSEVFRFRDHPIWRRLASQSLPLTQPACATAYVEDLLRRSSLYEDDATIVRAPCACPAALVESASAGKFGRQPEVPSRPQTFRLLTLARLHPRKGQHLTAQALGLLPAEVKQRLHYQIAGEGPPEYRRLVERTCEAAGIAFDIRGAVAPHELTEVYSACDAFVMTSVTLPNSVEGFGISYLEASIHGKPVIGFRTGGVSEAVLHDETGFLVPEGDVAGVADAILRLERDPALCHRLGQRGREYALSFRWEDAARVLCEAASA